MWEPEEKKEEIDEDEERCVLISEIDVDEWKLECERVAPSLKYSVKEHQREWRSHLEQSKEYQSKIKKLFPDTKISLEKISDESARVLERITKKEQSINRNLDSVADQ